MYCWKGFHRDMKSTARTPDEGGSCDVSDHIEDQPLQTIEESPLLLCTAIYVS